MNDVSFARRRSKNHYAENGYFDSFRKPVVFIICSGFGRPSEAWLWRQATRMPLSDVHVVTWDHVHKGEYPAMNAAVHVSPCRRVDGRRRLWWNRLTNARRGFYSGRRAEGRWFRRLVAEFRPSVMLAQYGPIGLRMLPLARAHGIPLVVHFHGHDLSAKLNDQSYVKHLVKSLPLFSMFVVVAEYMQKWLHEHGVENERIHLIPCGVPVEEFQSSIAVTPGPCRFVAVGRFVEKKRPDLVVRAFAECASRVDAVTLTFIGDGKMKSDCERLARELGVAGRIRFLGSQPNTRVQKEMSSAHVFVQHSVVGLNGDMEGWPVSVAEAEASGLPVVATRHASIPEQVEEDVTGFLVNELDWHGMGEAMATLAANPALRARMGQAGRDRMKQFDAANQIAKLENVLRAVARRDR